MLFDTHIHLDLLHNLQQQIDAARQHDIQQFLIPGVRPESWPTLIKAANSTPGALAAPGLHPLAAREWSRQTREQLLDYLQQPESVAIGEIGLDGLLLVPLELQELVFREQLQIAVELNLPVVLHSRRATGRLLKILTEERADRVGGILHAFTGSLETAREMIRLGFALGIGPPVTYPDAERISEMIRKLPAEWLVLETDAPDQAPHPHLRETGQPVWLQYIHRRVAELRDWNLNEAALITTRNARRVLRLQENSK
jgi:TatD DNase family protein